MIKRRSIISYRKKPVSNPVCRKVLDWDYQLLSNANRDPVSSEYGSGADILPCTWSSCTTFLIRSVRNDMKDLNMNSKAPVEDELSSSKILQNT